MTEKIEVSFLGTGSAVPTAKRNHPAILLNYKAESILFDCGEGTQRQFRKAKLNPCKLTKIFITHWHGDHVLGIPGLLQTLFFNDYRKTLDIYGPKGTKHYISLMMNIFVNVGRLKVNIHEISSGKVVENEDFVVLAEEMKHGTSCLAYSFVEKDKIRLNKTKLTKLKIPNSPILGELKQGKDIIVNGKTIPASDVSYLEKGKKVTIALDTRETVGLVDFAKDSDLFICESTYIDEEDIAKEYGHMTLASATRIAKEAIVKKLVLMHLSQKYEKSENKIFILAKKMFKNVIIAKDLMKISL
ncbi:MAG TPA: ribonuclease Z [Candidatus Paceibacterota bacterium]|nr:ribonuclease Z [Candidatus Paceibacterota bacterium]